MQNSESTKARSISRTLSAGLIITLIVVAGLSLGVNFMLSSHKARAELETRAEEYIEALTEALRIPIWNFDEKTIEAICASYSQNEFVARLRVEDQTGAVLFEKDEAEQQLVASRSRDIFYQDNRIGRVHIALASGYYSAVNRQLFQSFSLTIVIMIGALLVMTGVLLRQFLKKPMSRFIQMVDTYAAGESDAFKQGIPYEEFRPLVDVLDKMGEKIASQMRSIRKLNEDLERRVEERTAELRASEEKSRLLLESVGEGIFGVDPDGKVAFINPAANRMLGYDPEELIGHDVHNKIHHSHADGSAYPKTKCPMYLTHAESTDYRVVDEVLWRKDGSSFPVEYTSMPIEKDGQVVGAVVTFMDITDRKQAEQAIRESQAKYRDLVENANSIIFQMDTQGNITFFNRFAQEFFGYSEAEILGRNVVGTIIPETESGGRNLEIMIQDLVKHPERYADNENENIRRNGELAWIAWTNRAIYDDENRVSEILCIGIDRTEQKKAEKIVKDSEQRLGQIINFLPDPTWVIDNEGTVVTWNQAMENLTGVAAADMVGKGNYEYALPFYGERRPILIDLVREWNPEYEKKYLSIKRKGDKLISESHHPNLSDGGLHLSGIASLIYDAAGQVAGAIESLRDITERKHMEEEMRRNLDELERFNKLAMGRELKMIQLKEEINELMIQSGKVEKYKIVS